MYKNIYSSFFAELGVEYMLNIPITTINHVIKAINNNQVNQGIQTILMLDEIFPSNDTREDRQNFNLADLNTSNQNLDMLLAINPATKNDTLKGNFRFIQPEHLFFYCLQRRYRNQLSIGILMVHMQGYIQRKR